MTPPATKHDRIARPHHVVTAVLVAHDGARWLPTTLQAVKSQRRPVQRFVAVDNGSRDETRELLERAVGASSVLGAPRRTGFAAAAHLAVEAFANAPDIVLSRPDDREPVEWIWLLHDDSAPSPDALDLLLELADDMPSASVIGPKLRGWDNPRVLLEVGLTVDRGGRRETGLEPGELDHGQHDGDRDVLAVSTAGMLVRRDVWESLGGLDDELPLFRDDLDFGWRANLAGHRVVVCSRAIVYHAEAAASGRRRIHAATPFRRRLDRQAALRTMLVNASALWLPWIAVRLFIACLLRTLGFFLIKRPFDAVDEIVAMVAVFLRPRRLLRARAARAGIRVVGRREISVLLAPRGTRFRHYADSVSQRLAGVGSDDASDQRGLLRRLLVRPGLLLFAVLLAVSLIAERHVLTGALYGGALLPAPTGASDLWRSYTQSWHPTGFGSAAVAPPYLALLAILATVLFGSARLAVQVLLLGAVPLAGVTAYLAARRLAPQPRLRVWLAAAYALLPVATGAVASGRLGTCVVVILLPVVLAASARALLPLLRDCDEAMPLRRGTRHDVREGKPRSPGMRPAWVAAIPLTVATAFDPVLFALLAPIFVVVLVVGAARRRGLLARRSFVLLATPPVLLLPWTIRVVQHPALLATGLGRTASDLQAPRLDPISVALVHPGGPGMPPVWLYGAVVLAAFAGLLQLTRPWPARLGWLLAIDGIVGGLLISHVHVQEPGAAVAVPGWPGTATALIGAGLLISVAVAGARLRARLAVTSFGWRQPAAAVLAVCVLATPAVSAGLWLVRGTGPLLRAGAADVLPAFVTDPAASHDQPRTVVLRPGPGADTSHVSYALLRDRSPRLGDADLPPDPAQRSLVDAAVGDLAGGFGQQAATELSHLGVRYVLVPVKDDGGLNDRIAEAGGLLPKATDSGWKVWEVNAVAGRLAIVNAGDDAVRLPATDGAVGRDVPPIRIDYSDTPQLLVLAEAPSPQWRAVAVGPDAGEHVPLPATTRHGMQAFTLPTSQYADVVIYRGHDHRAGWLIFQLVVVLLVLAAALPAGRRAADQQRFTRSPVDPDAAEVLAARDEVGAGI